ncbi:MAG: VOC family protein [Myxococcales bacterium]|nr:VOC family protein [Myxococcales bacterium]
MSKSANHFVWYDLTTTDPDAAIAFYTEVIGWKTSDAHQGDYTMYGNSETTLGGFSQLPKEAAAHGVPPHWMVYVASDHLETTISKATGLGASVQVPPTVIPDAGRFAVLRDPQGATFALYESTKAYELDPPKTQLGRFSWHEMYADDPETAFKFYSDLFGWAEAGRMPLPGLGDYVMFKGDFELHRGGFAAKPPPMAKAPSNWLFYITVADLDATLDVVKRLGGDVWNGPMEVPGGDVVAMCHDPQGAAFALHMTPANR